MAGTATTAAVVLAMVLVWAAISKGLRREATAATFATLRLPAPALLAVAVPLAEVAAAALLVIRPAAGAVVALALLAGFTVVVVRALLSGVTAGCGCFGAASDDPVGPTDVLRNGMLAALAAVATGTVRPVAPSLAEVALVVACTAVGVAVLAVVHRLAPLSSVPTNAPIGRHGGRGGAPGAGR